MSDDTLNLSGKPQADPIEQEAERRGMAKGIAIVLAVLAVLALVALWLFNWGPLKPQPAADNTVPVTTLPNDGSLAPELDSTKTPEAAPTNPDYTPEAGASDAPATNAPSNGAKPSEEVTVALSRWNWIAAKQAISVAGFLPGVVENGGTCTLEATNGSTTVSNSQAATTDAHQTVCAMNLVDPKLTPGQWTVTMSYEGPSGSGTSEPAQVTIN